MSVKDEQHRVNERHLAWTSHAAERYSTSMSEILERASTAIAKLPAGERLAGPCAISRLGRSNAKARYCSGSSARETGFRSRRHMSTQAGTSSKRDVCPPRAGASRRGDPSWSL